MPFGIDDVVGLTGSAAQLAGGIYQSEVAQNMQQKSMDFSAGQSATQWQRAVADMKMAGLNPMLAYSRGPNMAMGGTPGQAVNPMEGVVGAAQSATQARVNVATAAKTEAETREVEARIPTYGASIENIQQNIRESVQRISELQARSTSEYASADQARQNVVNMQAMIPQIKATVGQLQSLAQLNDAKRQEALTHAGLNSSQAASVSQIVKQNLPELQRQLGELDRYGKELALPEKEQSRVVQDSFLGSMGAVLRVLNPLNNFMR